MCLFWIILSMALLLLCVLLYLYHRRTLEQSEQKIHQLQSEFELRLKSHESLVHPHFLFNLLNNLRYLVRYKPEQAEHSMIQLTNLLRLSSAFTNSELISLEEEIAFLKTYIELQKIRLSEEQEIIVAFPSKFPSKQIPPLVLINYVENAFKYGISAKSPKPIVISMEADSNQLRFLVKNGKTGNNEPIISNESGLGMAEQRLKNIYPGKYTVSISDSPEQFEVTVIVQWN